MKSYSINMLETVIRGLSHVLTPLFIAGMAGATVVVIITFSKDVIQFFSDESGSAPNQD